MLRPRQAPETAILLPTDRSVTAFVSLPLPIVRLPSTFPFLTKDEDGGLKSPNSILTGERAKLPPLLERYFEISPYSLILIPFIQKDPSVNYF